MTKRKKVSKVRPQNKPLIPHQDVVDFIIQGRTAEDLAKKYDLTIKQCQKRIWDAFRVLKIVRPKNSYMSYKLNCKYCNKVLHSRTKKGNVCDNKICRSKKRKDYRKNRPDIFNAIEERYRKTEKYKAKEKRFYKNSKLRRREGSIKEKLGKY